MENLSDKAKIVYATFKMLEASGEANAVTSYTVLNYIEENEELQEHEILKDMSEEDFVDIIMNMNIKSVSAVITALCRKNLLGKTATMSIKVDGERKDLKKYFLL